jgi:hypothetical protein
MDPIGTILLICTITSYILPLQFGGQTKAWNSSTVIGLLVSFPLMIIAFMAWEWFQGERAAFPPRLMSNGLILVNSIYAFLFAGSYFIIVYYLPYYFQSIQNVNPTMSGVRNLPLIVSMSLAIIVSGGSITKTGHTAPLMVVGGSLQPSVRVCCTRWTSVQAQASGLDTKLSAELDGDWPTRFPSMRCMVQWFPVILQP